MSVEGREALAGVRVTAVFEEQDRVSGSGEQKVLAAHAAGLTEVILPERNAPDLDDVPSDVREHMPVYDWPNA